MQGTQATVHTSTKQAGLAIKPMSRTIGAEISGIDLREPMTEATRDAVYQALLDWKVIFFRNQDITRAQHMAFSRQFGDLEIHPFAPQLDEAPEALQIFHTADNPGRENIWHSDVTWRQEPSLGSLLRCIKGPQMGGDTLFADMYAAYDGLSDTVKELIEGKVARHDFPGFRKRMQARGVSPERIAEMLEQYPNPHHPVVRTHPDTGKRAIYVNAAFTQEIVGMDPAESRRLLNHLYAQAATPEYQCRFQWSDNAIAFWDNRACQHYATSDYWPDVRTMERVTVIGDTPFYDPERTEAVPYEFKGLVEMRRNGHFQAY